MTTTPSPRDLDPRFPAGRRSQGTHRGPANATSAVPASRTTPLVQQRADDLGIDHATVPSTNGRITMADLDAAVQKRDSDIRQSTLYRNWAF